MENIQNKKLKLKSGYYIPVLGLGTWDLTGEACEKIVKKALDLGYRHIDTAELYQNEVEIGRAIKGFEREELFITSKVVPEKLRKYQLMDACEDSLSRLDTEYLDLYLIHWPNDDIPLSETFEAMARLVEMEKVRSV